jgi:hypothetical protein
LGRSFAAIALLGQTGEGRPTGAQPAGTIVGPDHRGKTVARYLKQVADREGIPAELLGDIDASTVARLRGTGKKRPLLRSRTAT